ncbi:MAG: hypothetical protein ACRCSV_00820 [Chlamydiales bacterium]
MAIYNIFDHAEKDQMTQPSSSIEREEIPKEDRYRLDRFFSAVTARLFFIFLFFADILWGIYAIAMFSLFFVLNTITLFRSKILISKLKSSFLSIKRFIICAFSLMIAIFSPSLGILFSCMYFMLYDRKGIEEVVPSSLREQFEDLIPHSS